MEDLRSAAAQQGLSALFGETAAWPTELLLSSVPYGGFVRTFAPPRNIPCARYPVELKLLLGKEHCLSMDGRNPGRDWVQFEYVAYKQPSTDQARYIASRGGLGGGAGGRGAGSSGSGGWQHGSGGPAPSSGGGSTSSGTSGTSSGGGWGGTPPSSQRGAASHSQASEGSSGGEQQGGEGAPAGEGPGSSDSGGGSSGFWYDIEDCAPKRFPLQGPTKVLIIGEFSKHFPFPAPPCAYMVRLPSVFWRVALPMRPLHVKPWGHPAAAAAPAW